MSRTAASFRAGRLTEAQFLAQVERFWRQLGVNSAGQQLVTPASPGSSPPARPAAAAQPAAFVRSAAPAPPPPPVASEDETSWISHLRELAQLHDQGLLSDDHYEAAKRRILEKR
jgi:hypothetical protein